MPKANHDMQAEGVGAQLAHTVVTVYMNLKSLP
jgi:hypothetical protein